MIGHVTRHDRLLLHAESKACSCADFLHADFLEPDALKAGALFGSATGSNKGGPALVFKEEK